MKFLFTLLLVIASTVNYAQQVQIQTMAAPHYPRHHLEPLDSFDIMFNKMREPILSKGFSKSFYARYICSPSFDPDYAFSVEKSKSGYTIIIANILSENYSQAKQQKKRVTVISNRRAIGQDLYNEIGALFQLLADQTKDPGNRNFINDGTSYYFSKSVNETLVHGTVHSPNEDDLTHELVLICDDLYYYVWGKYFDEGLMINRIKTLMTKMKAQNN